MSSSNDIHLETYNRNHPPVENGTLVDISDHKFINDDCNIVVNGRHNYVVPHDQDNNELRDHDEEVKPFLDENGISDLADSGMSSTEVLDTSSNSVVTMKESTLVTSVESAEESEGDGEHESCTHLLQKKCQEGSSPKCQKSKVHKISTLRSSPSKKHSTHDNHSHIQHRPLGLQDNNNIVHSTKKKFCNRWRYSVTGVACAAFCLSIIAGLACLMMANLYRPNPATCCDVTDRQWWQNTVMYEIFPASFLDTDSDGFGDFQGVIQKLNYIKNFSVDVVRLNSIFSALDYPLEYEHVIDFSNVDPHLGRMEDFEALVKEIHDRGMYVILDMNPTMTSDQHTWAAHWLLHRPGRYESFYVNVTDDEVEPPLEPNPPISQKDWPPPHRTFGSHLFLNWSNTLVQKEMLDVLEFWLSQGVDGFYIKHVENMHFQDPNHIANAIQQWRHLLDRFSVNSTRKVLMTSHTSMEYLSSVLDTLTYWSVLTLPDLVDVSLDVSQNGSVKESFEKPRQYWQQFSFHTPMLCWHIGSVESMRLASRLGSKSPMGSVLLLATLPGSCSIYYGDEMSIKDAMDPVTTKLLRGGQLGLMQWSSDSHANFTSESTTPWIPVHPEYQSSNVESRPELLTVLRRLVELKTGPLLKFTLQNEIPSGPSFINDIMNKLQIVYDWKKGPRYTWLHSSSKLIVVEIVTTDKFIVMWNNGQEVKGLTDDENLSEFYLNYASRDFDVIVSTNDSFTGRLKLQDVQLQSGEAFVGHLVT